MNVVQKKLPNKVSSFKSSFIQSGTASGISNQPSTLHHHHHHHGCARFRNRQRASLGHSVCRRPVLCETSKAAVERELEIWRDQFERHGLRVSRTEAAYMLCNDYDNNSRNYEEIRLGDDKLNTVTTFKYLGSIFDRNGGAESDIDNRVKLAWMKWKQLTGVICDKKVP